MATPHNNIDFKIIFQSMPGMGIILLPDHPHFTIIDVNNDLLLFTKTVKETLTGKSLFDVFPDNPGDVAASGVHNLRNSLEQVIQTKQQQRLKVQRYDVKNESGSFSEFYWSALNTPILNKDGDVEYILHTSTNITDQVTTTKTAGAKRESYEYYDAAKENILKRESEKQALNRQAYNLFMQAPVGFSLLRGDDHIVELVNLMALRFTGKKREESIGKPVVDLLPEIEKQGYITLLDRVKRGESFSLRESKVAFVKDGQEKLTYQNIFFQPYFEGDNIEGVLAVFMDVTEQVLTRKKVEEISERFETMANNIPNLAWIANADGWIVWYNNRWYEYTGTTPQQMEGWGWQSVHDPKKLPAVIEKWNQSLTDGKPFEMVFPLKGADKIFRPFLTRVVPIRDNDGKVIRWLGTNTDITKQKEVERMKDDFISIASHELKTPLTTIKAYGQIAEDMLREKGDKETLGMMKRMSNQVNRLNILIEDLLDVTRIQKGKLIYNEDFFDFNKLVKEVIGDMQKTTGTHKIKHHLDSTAKVFGNINKLSQVINNLISNAIKYSPKADKIVISSEIQKDGVQLSVQDFGIGILSKYQKKIFTQFYRVNGGNQVTFPGMGIGLYICREIIARHGGKIWIKSKINKGSVFYIWLPFDYRNKSQGLLI